MSHVAALNHPNKLRSPHNLEFSGRLPGPVLIHMEEI